MCLYFGIVQAGGWQALAEMIIEGETESDSWAVDPRRLRITSMCATAAVIETYSHEYAMHFPQIHGLAGRKAKYCRFMIGDWGRIRQLWWLGIELTGSRQMTITAWPLIAMIASIGLIRLEMSAVMLQPMLVF